MRAARLLFSLGKGMSVVLRAVRFPDRGPIRWERVRRGEDTAPYLGRRARRNAAYLVLGAVGVFPAERNEADGDGTQKFSFVQAIATRAMGLTSVANWMR